MKSKAVLWSALIAGLGILAAYFTGALRAQSTRQGSLPEAFEGKGERAEAAEREAFMISMHGYDFGVPKNAHANAVSQTQMMQAAQAKAQSLATAPLDGAGDWTFIGPLPMKGQLANFGGNLFGPAFNATGRISAIAVDPLGNIYAGAASGGVWLSKDGGAHFTSIGDSLPTQSIGSILVDSNNSNPPRVFVGTGEGNSSLDSYYGQGLFSSTDFGATWAKEGTGDANGFTTYGRYQAFTALGLGCSGTAVSTTHILLGTGGGVSDSRGASFFFECYPPFFNCQEGAIYESLPPNPGVSWQRTFGPNNVMSNGGPIRTLTAGLGTFFATEDGIGVLTGTPPAMCDTAISWQQATQPVASVGRSSVAANPSADTYDMAGSTSGDIYAGFFRSTDLAGSWTKMTTPCAQTVDGGASWTTSCTSVQGATVDSDLAGAFSQAFYDQALELWPGDPQHKTLFFGGVAIYKSTDQGATWNFIASGGGTHSDQHAIAFDPTDSNRVFVGNDGGLFLYSVSAGTWTALNDTISAGQIQGIGPHPTDDNKALAGFQDNGTQLYTGALGWGFAETGDAGFALFDHMDPNFAYHTFSRVVLSTSTNGGATWDSTDPTNAIKAAMMLAADPGSSFYPPLASDPTVAHRVLFGAHHIYQSTDGMFTWAVMTQDLTGGCTSGNCALTDIEFAPNDHTVAYSLSKQTFSPVTPFKVFRSLNADQGATSTWNDVTPPIDATKTQGDYRCGQPDR